MARPKSSDICPKCGRQGFLRIKPTRNGNYLNSAYSLYRYFVHHGSKTEKRKECYVEDILRKFEKYIFTGPDGKLRYEIIQFYRNDG